MEITVTIPDDLAEALDARFKAVQDQPRTDAEGNTIIPRRFPGGLADWLREILAHNLREAAAPLQDQMPAARALNQEIESRRKALLDMYKPEVRGKKV
ncbi:MAG: hypothetical protein KIT09_35825 [Bryobacteraceae bacterium]|nr:hypothetical protein [Bryobacteraceae bacterium]